MKRPWDGIVSEADLEVYRATARASHAVNLFDLASKYADVMPFSEALCLIDIRGTQ